MKKIAAATAALLMAAAAGCASYDHLPVRHQTAQKEIGAQSAEALNRLVDCISAAVPEMDDGTSDAATVGAATARMCPREAEAWILTKTAGQPPQNVDAFRRAAPRFLAEASTESVLRYRAERRRASQRTRP